LFLRLLTQVLFILPPRHDLVQSVEGARRDEKDVGGVYLDSVASRLSGRVLLGHVDHRPLDHLEHALLDALATNVAELMNPGNGTNLVDLIQENDAGLRARNVEIRILEINKCFISGRLRDITSSQFQEKYRKLAVPRRHTNIKANRLIE
jgi:hypothetical protein